MANTQQHWVVKALLLRMVQVKEMLEMKPDLFA